MITPSIDDLNLLAEARASFCAFINLHFLILPDIKFVKNVRGMEYAAFLGKLDQDINIHPDIVQGARLMKSFLDQNGKLDEEQFSKALGVDRTRLYRGVSPTYGPPPPYEAVWTIDPDKHSALLQQIATIYHQDGLTQAQDLPERGDYIGIELDYIENLARKEAKLLKSNKFKPANALFERQRSFLEEHLMKWVPRFVESALGFVKTDFYHGHLLMLQGFILEQVEIFSTISTSPKK